MNKTKFETFALGHILCSWPDDLSYEQIMEMLHDDEAWEAHNETMDEKGNDYYYQQLTVCEEYEHHSGAIVAEHIETLKNDCERTFGENK